MVSEDSQGLGRLPKVHRLRDLRDLDDPGYRQVSLTVHETDYLSELVEVATFRRSEWVLLEERDDDVPQLAPSLDAVSVEVLPVIVMPGVPKHLAASEEAN